MQLTASGHTIHAIRALLDLGWTIDAAPTNARLQRNGQQIRLRWGKKHAAYRLFIYKITGSGRNSHERRVEITTTYEKGLSRLPGYEDIVLGYEPTHGVFVGVDARRIEHGGVTGNASSFIDPEGLAQATASTVTIVRRQSQLFGIERHAYFKPPRLAEYLVNVIEIHRGAYTGSGDFSKNQPLVPSAAMSVPKTLCSGSELLLHGPASLSEAVVFKPKVIEALEEGDSKALSRLKLTQTELMRLGSRLQEIGLKGEELVLKAEMSRLRRAGRADLAAQVSWVSQSSPFEGYDILSFETNGSRRFIEVKSTPGQKKSFPMTENEWRVASRKRDAYFIYRVTDVESRPRTTVIQNPVALETVRKLSRSPLVWLVTYQ